MLTDPPPNCSVGFMPRPLLHSILNYLRLINTPDVYVCPPIVPGCLGKSSRLHSHIVIKQYSNIYQLAPSFANSLAHFSLHLLVHTYSVNIALMCLWARKWALQKISSVNLSLLFWIVTVTVNATLLNLLNLTSLFRVRRSNDLMDIIPAKMLPPCNQGMWQSVNHALQMWGKWSLTLSEATL